MWVWRLRLQVLQCTKQQSNEKINWVLLLLVFSFYFCHFNSKTEMTIWYRTFQIIWERYKCGLFLWTEFIYGRNIVKENGNWYKKSIKLYPAQSYTIPCFLYILIHLICDQIITFAIPLKIFRFKFAILWNWLVFL